MHTNSLYRDAYLPTIDVAAAEDRVIIIPTKGGAKSKSTLNIKRDRTDLVTMLKTTMFRLTHF